MEMTADFLLAAGSLGAGFYCFVLGRRLNRFNDLEKGVGGAVAVLSAQVDDLTKTLSAAQQTAEHSATSLSDLSMRAEAISRRLELQMASLHDLPTAPVEEAQKTPYSDFLPPKPAEPPTPSEPMFIRHRTVRQAS